MFELTEIARSITTNPAEQPLTNDSEQGTIKMANHTRLAFNEVTFLKLSLEEEQGGRRGEGTESNREAARYGHALSMQMREPRRALLQRQSNESSSN